MKHVTKQAAFSLASLMVLGALLAAGCSKSEPPSDPGYYTGPMQGKGKAAGPAAGGKTGVTN